MLELASLLLEPPLLSPGLQLHLPPLEDVVVVEYLLDLRVPLGEGSRHVAEVEAVEGVEQRTRAVERTEVDDTKAEPVKLPVRDPAPGIGTRHLATLGQLQGHLLQGLHDEVDVEGAV